MDSTIRWNPTVILIRRENLCQHDPNACRFSKGVTQFDSVGHIKHTVFGWLSCLSITTNPVIGFVEENLHVPPRCRSRLILECPDMKCDEIPDAIPGLIYFALKHRYAPLLVTINPGVKSWDIKSRGTRLIGTMASITIHESLHICYVVLDDQNGKRLKLLASNFSCIYELEPSSDWINTAMAHIKSMQRPKSSVYVIC